MAYTSVSEVKSYVGLTVADDDALLATLVAAAQQTIDRYCNRVFEASADMTRYFHAIDSLDKRNARILHLDGDLCAITSVVNGDGATVPATDYVTLPTNYAPYFALELTRETGTAWTFDDTPEKAIAVTGRWAFSTTAPADVAYAALRLTAWMYRQRDTQTDADRPMMSDSGAMIMPLRLPADVKDILAPYRRLVL